MIIFCKWDVDDKVSICGLRLIMKELIWLKPGDPSSCSLHSLAAVKSKNKTPYLSGTEKKKKDPVL